MDRSPSPRRVGSRSRNRDSEGLFDWDLKSDRVHFSPRWRALIGCEDHEIGSQPGDWFQRVHPDDSAALSREIELARDGDSKEFTCRYRLRHKDGTYRWMDCRGTVVRDAAGHPIRLQGSQSDVTVEMVADQLTGLPNRLLLVDRVTHCLQRARRSKSFQFALLLIDLGRPDNVARRSAKTADPLLTAVARRLESCLRTPSPSVRQNDLVARIDGDQFGILLDGLKDVAHAKIAAERILGELLNPIPLGGREVRLSASIGVAVSATGYTTADRMMQDAEVAQHRARMLGGSHCELFDTAILKSEQSELQLENDFEAALQRRDFILMFQPIVSLESNAIVGFEALVRWHHPVFGVIPPDDFIPLAERTGFIIPLGNWILGEACRRLAHWDADTPQSRHVSVSVNIASAQVNDPSLADQVGAALRESGLEPRRVVLELTEGIAMANPTATTTLLMRLRALGVRISLDDFGTGYSSLAYLRQFPADTLKIDRSFVRGMVTNRDTAEIVAGVMNMAQQLGLHVVAEGIEYEDQCERLHALKCDAGQGNLFAPPLDADTALALVRTGLAPRPDRQPASRWQRVRRSPLVASTYTLVANHHAAFSAAALALLLSTGFVVVAARARSAGSSPRPPANNEDGTLPVPSGDPQPPVSGVPQASLAAAAAANSETTKNEPATRPANNPPKPASSTHIDAAAPPPAKAAAPSLPLIPRLPSAVAALPPPQASAATAVTHVPASVQVIHLHRLGSCHGHLEVTREGVAFVSETDTEDDSFTLKHTDFLAAVDGDTLILKSATRTYRFKATGPESKTQLRDLADAMARARR